VGIGSLIVNARPVAASQGARQHVRAGRPAVAHPARVAGARPLAPADRAWLGINCVEVDGRMRVVRVTEDSPADVAGLEVGDQILAIDGRPVSHAGERCGRRCGSGGGPERAVSCEIERGGQQT
jgi:serine protease Do